LAGSGGPALLFNAPPKFGARIRAFLQKIAAKQAIRLACQLQMESCANEGTMNRNLP
jgi:hypothetical protein